MAQIGYGGFLGIAAGTGDIDKVLNIPINAGPGPIRVEFHRTILNGIAPDPTNTEWDKYTLTELKDPGNIGSAKLVNGTGDTDMLQPDGSNIFTNQNDWQHDTFEFTMDTTAAAWKNLAVGKSLSVSYRVDAVEYLRLRPDQYDSLNITLTFVKTCYDAGTMILMAEGREKAAGEIAVGDLVQTVDHGAQAVRWVGRNTITPAEMEHFPSWRPVRIAAGALGKGLPVTDLVVSQLHRVVVRGDVAREAFGTDELLIAARYLTTLDGIEVLDSGVGVDFVHFMFDNHEIVTANGALAESFCVSPMSRSQIGAEQLAELEAMFPELATLVRDGRHDLVRPVAREHLAESLVARHKSEGVALQ